MSVLRIFRNLAVLVILAVGVVRLRSSQAVAQNSATCRGSLACGSQVRSCSICQLGGVGECVFFLSSCYDADSKRWCLQRKTICRHP